ncbi:MAG: hypothetical protein JO130_18345 [Solirubrobacterales bacterium]|nr:hypothetical protein [Solirubrobacterales bacterium]
MQAPTAEEVDRLPEGALLICFLDPAGAEDRLRRLAEQRVTVFSMSTIPRTGAAQSMDAISSMGSVARRARDRTRRVLPEGVARPAARVRSPSTGRPLGGQSR